MRPPGVKAVAAAAAPAAEAAADGELQSVDAFGNKSLVKFMLQSKPFNRRITECASNWKVAREGVGQQGDEGGRRGI